MVNVGDPGRSQKDRVSGNKPQSQESRKAYQEVRCVILPMKRVMTVEGRTLGKYDLNRRNVMEFTENSILTETKLKRIAALSAANPYMVFTHVIHHFNVESLRACYQELDGKKAIGSDGIDKVTYGENLELKLQNLIDRMRLMTYIPGSIRQVLISKEGKPGVTRPLGISNFEDKIIQKMMHKVLESIYDPLFHENSYGFRPGRSCHDAIGILQAHLSCKSLDFT